MGSIRPVTLPCQAVFIQLLRMAAFLACIAAVNSSGSDFLICFLTQNLKLTGTAMSAQLTKPLRIFLYSGPVISRQAQNRLNEHAKGAPIYGAPFDVVLTVSE